MKKIYSVFLFVISLVFFSCSSAFDEHEGKIEFTLPYGTVRNVRAAEGEVSETTTVSQSYAFYLRFTNNSTFEDKTETGVSGDTIILADIDPGVWTVYALACELDDKEALELYIAERGEEAYKKQNNTIGFKYFQGIAKAQVNAGQTSNVTLTLSKVLQDDEVFEGLTVTLAASEDKITAKNYDSIMSNSTVFARYRIMRGEDFVDFQDYKVTDFTYTKLEPNEIGYKPVVFTYVNNEETYQSEPVIVPVYYDLADSIEDIKLSYESEYSVTKGDEVILAVYASQDDVILNYYLENSQSSEDAVPYAFELYPVAAAWSQAGDDTISPFNEKTIDYYVNTDTVGSFVYYNTTRFTLYCRDPKTGSGLNKFILPAVHSPVEIKVTVLPLPEYTVKFVKAGSEPETFETIDAKTVTKGETVEQPVVSIQEGYTFDGWYIDDGYYTPFNFKTPITADITLYGRWTKNETPKYTITFESEFTEAKEVTVEEGPILKVPESLTSDPVDGYVFDAWYTDKDCTTLYTFSAPVTSSFILYGKWIELPKYTVTFVYDSKTNEVTVIEGKTVSPDATETREGYRFDGWYTDKSYSEAYDFETPVKADLTLYARDILIEYKITYDLDGGENSDKNPTSYNVASGTLTLFDAQKEGYDFAGWTINISGEDEKIEKIEPSFVRDITLTATWTVKTFKVTFINVSGFEIGEKTVEYKAKVTPLSAPAMEGYTFKGWYADKDLTKEFDFDTPVDSDLIIYGKWVADSSTGVNVDFPEEPVTGVISFVLTSGDDILDPDSQGYYTVEQGETISIKASFDVESTENLVINWTVNGIDVESDGELLELDTSTYAGYTYIVCSVYDAETQKIIFTGNLNVAVIK